MGQFAVTSGGAEYFVETREAQNFPESLLPRGATCRPLFEDGDSFAPASAIDFRLPGDSRKLSDALHKALGLQLASSTSGNDQCPEYAFRSALLERYEGGDSSVLDQARVHHSAELTQDSAESDFNFLQRCLEADYKAGPSGGAVFQLHYDLIHGSDLDGPLASICADLEHFELTGKDFSRFEDFQAWWADFNHYEIEDAEPTEHQVKVAAEQLQSAYQVLSQDTLSFEIVMARYRGILESNPGKALYTGFDTFAVLDSEGNLFGAHAKSDGSLSCDEIVNEAFDFDSSAFGVPGWDGETQESTLLPMVKPQLVDLPDFRPGQKSTPTIRMG